MDTQPIIPDKLYFKIREVTAITGLAAYVLRFWESEFPEISPKRTESDQRLYRKKDIETILTIKHLLYERKFTIEGAKKELQHMKMSGKTLDPILSAQNLQEIIADIKKELREILTILQD